MDKAAKAKIKQLVLNLRHILEADITLGLKPLGIFLEQDWLPESQLLRSDEETRRKRARITAVIQAAIDQGYTHQDATYEYIRKTALTYLIRLVGLKCLEVRHLIDEVIITKIEYGGRSLFHRDFRHAHPELAAQADDALPSALEAACRLVTQQIRQLFDPDDEWSIIQPRYSTFKRAITQINDLPTTLWLEDEIVGWVYQFYRIEDRDRVRKRGQPQKADDVAAINQFYTPRWVVQFLVDNTLGRLWLEMHPDSSLRQKCSYLVMTDDLPQPSSASIRQAKSPWEIRLLDPACGTMHFGFYASEIFFKMYQETKAKGWADKLPDRRSISQLTEAEMVSCIFRYNLFGITIDMWAMKLATLSLYMKLKALHSEAKMIELNVICADAYLPDGEIRQQFLDKFQDDPDMQQALLEIFTTMGDIGQVGSLFRPKEQLQRILEKKKHPTAQWEEQQKLATQGQTSVRQRELGEVTGPGAGWRIFRELDDILQELQEFAREYWIAENHAGHLLALKTEENLRLLDVLSQPYDVVVMNPPYGDTTHQAKQYLRQMYPLTHYDLYATFLEQALKMVTTTKGYIGALVSRTFMFLSSFAKFRREILLSKTKVATLAELGLGVLDDATVRPAALVFSPRTNDSTSLQTIFFRLSSIEPEKKSSMLQWAINNPDKAAVQGIRFCLFTSTFESLPGAPFTYWAPSRLISKFLKFPSLDTANSLWHTNTSQIANVRTGLGTRDDARFLRFFWEVSPSKAGNKYYWPYFAKGGTVSPYYRDLELVVEWVDNGANIKAFSKSIIRCEEFYFKEGITYTLESEKDSLGAYYLPQGCIFGDKGPAIFTKAQVEIWPLLAILNSLAIASFIRMLTPDRTRTVGFVSSLPIPNHLDYDISNRLAKNSKQIFDLKSTWDTGNEICTRFTAPWLLQLAKTKSEAFNQGLHRTLMLLGNTDVQTLPCPTPPPHLDTLLEHIYILEKAADACLQQLQTQIDGIVYDLYEISLADRALIERELDNRPPELIWPQMEGKSKQEKQQEHVRRLLSYFVLQTLKAHPVGILPLVEGTGQPTVLVRLREEMEAAFGAEVAFQLEDDAGRILDGSVSGWLEGEFNKWHIQLYKRRPIIWHVVSPQGTFSAFIYYHKLDRDTLPKLRNIYLWALRDRLKNQLEVVRAEKNYKAIQRLEVALDDLLALDERLERLIEAGYDPIIDDGVKVNILPLQEAEVLRPKKVV